MKKCPFCAKEIQDEAIKCKHCNSILTGQAASVKLTNPGIGKDKMILGGIGIVIGIIVVINGLQMNSRGITALGSFVTFASFFIWLYGKIKNWYYWK